MQRSTQLRAVLVSDLVDSTALVQKLGDRQAAECLQRHDALARALIVRHGGCEHDRTDGFVVLFERPIEAIGFALEYHEALKSLDLGAQAKLVARVGIHLGEVEVWDNDPEVVARGARPTEIEGLSIAMAARINSIARPGQTLLSSAAYEVARRSSVGAAPQAALHWHSHSFYRFKGVSDPVEVFEVSAQAAGQGNTPRETDKARKVLRDGRQSLVVLPFVNQSPGSDIEYISDGLADEVITSLSDLEGLRVIARTSAMQLKGRVDYGALAEELNVQFVLRGSVRKAKDSLRITARLANVETEEELWGHSFSGTLDSILTVQEDIAQSVVEALKLRLNVAQTAKLTARPIPDAKAYEYYLRAREQIYAYTKDGLNRALKYLETGQEILGDNPEILAAMGYVFWQFRNAGVDPGPQSLYQARCCADKLLACDSSSADGHRLLGLIEMHERGDIQSTIRHLKLSLEASPSDTDTLLWLSLMYGFAGRISSGYALAERLLSLDPLATLPRILPGFLAMLDGDLERACKDLLTSHELNAGNPITALSYAQALTMAGDTSRACAVFDAITQDVYGDFFSGLASVYQHAIKGDSARVQELLSAELAERAASDLQHSWNLAQCFALIEDENNAIAWLENAVNFGFWNYPLFARKDPLLASVRGSPSFERLMEAVKEKWVYFEV